MVDTAKQSYDKYLDTAYMKDLSAFDSCVKAGASSMQSNLWALAIVLFVYKLFVWNGWTFAVFAAATKNDDDVKEVKIFSFSDINK